MTVGTLAPEARQPHQLDRPQRRGAARRRTSRRRAPRSPRPRDSWRRHASAQMIVKPGRDPRDLRARKVSAPATTTTSSSGHRRLSIVAPGRTSGIIVAALASASSRAIGGLTSLRRADPRCRSSVADDPPAGRVRARLVVLVARAPRRASAPPACVAAPPLSRTVRAQEVDEAHRGYAEPPALRARSRTPSGAVDEQVGGLLELRAASRRSATPMQIASRSAPVGDRCAQARRTRRGRCGRRRRRARRRRRRRAAGARRRGPC